MKGSGRGEEARVRKTCGCPAGPAVALLCLTQPRRVQWESDLRLHEDGPDSVWDGWMCIEMGGGAWAEPRRLTQAGGGWGRTGR